jgi:pimeloyl-ACP methyl ester carboxylesterase
MKTPLQKIGSTQAATEILFLHGGPGMDPAYFFPYLESLSHKNHLITYRQGFSGAVTLPGLIDELKTVLASSQKPLFIFAHSWGSSLILEYLRRHKINRLKGLIFCAWTYASDFGQAYKKILLGHRLEHKLKNLKWHTDEDYKKNLPKLKELYFHPSTFDEAVQLCHRLQYNVALFNSINATYTHDYDLRDVLKNLKVPVLSVVGTGDRVTPLKYVRQGVRLIRHAQHEELDEASHFPFIEERARIVSFVNGFITGA